MGPSQYPWFAKSLELPKNDAKVDQEQPSRTLKAQSAQSEASGMFARV